MHKLGKPGFGRSGNAGIHCPNRMEMALLSRHCGMARGLRERAAGLGAAMRGVLMNEGLELLEGGQDLDITPAAGRCLSASPHSHAGSKRGRLGVRFGTGGGTLRTNFLLL